MAKRDDVVLKGTKTGVLIQISSDQEDFELIKAKLADRLASAERFLQGAEVTIDIGKRILTSRQLLELEDIIYQRYGLKVVKVIHGERSEEEEDEPTGDLARKESADKDKEVGGRRGEDGLRRGEEISPEATLLVKRTLRSGQSIRYPGNVVILGDVNPGAEVVAGGDIIVMGVLRGVAHAGAQGNDRAVVAAFRLMPTQLRIGNYISRPPEGEGNEPPGGPEVAQIKNGLVVVEAYQPQNLTG